MTKLIVQIPCLNEEETLPLAFEHLPTDIKGVDVIETLVINDRSTDRTVQVAAELGADHIISHRTDRGLARSFADGINHCLIPPVVQMPWRVAPRPDLDPSDEIEDSPQ